MISAMEGVGASMVKLALDAASLRHEAIAHNLANLHSEGYVPLGVSFESQLEALRRGQAPAKPELVALADRAPGPRPQDVDVEMVALSQNTIHYQALIKGLGVQLAILGSAIGDARGR
jgi:flagellar basal-body rod protein FlgB